MVNFNSQLGVRAALRFVGDSGLDEQRVFAQVERVRAEFIIRSCQNRGVEVYNDCLPFERSGQIAEGMRDAPRASRQTGD